MTPTVRASDLNAVLGEYYNQSFDVGDIFSFQETPGTYVKIGFNKQMLDVERQLTHKNGHFKTANMVREYLYNVFSPYYDYCLVKVEE